MLGIANFIMCFNILKPSATKGESLTNDCKGFLQTVMRLIQSYPHCIASFNFRVISLKSAMLQIKDL